MAPPIILLAPNKIGLRQPFPPDGFNAYPINAPNSNNIPFVTGNEQYQFNSFGRYNPPSAILSMWVDASQLVVSGAGKNAYIVTPLQRIVVPANSQGYIILTSQMPFNILISVDAGLVTGPLALILYNYNVFFTGQNGSAGNSGGGGTGGSGGSGGSGGGAGGFNGSIPPFSLPGGSFLG
jgi:hypothetical protein